MGGGTAMGTATAQRPLAGAGTGAGEGAGERATATDTATARLPPARVGQAALVGLGTAIRTRRVGTTPTRTRIPTADPSPWPVPARICRRRQRGQGLRPRNVWGATAARALRTAPLTSTTTTATATPVQAPAVAGLRRLRRTAAAMARQSLRRRFLRRHCRGPLDRNSFFSL